MPMKIVTKCTVHPNGKAQKDDEGEYCGECGDDRHMLKVKVHVKKEQEFEECDAMDATPDKD